MERKNREERWGGEQSRGRGGGGRGTKFESLKDPLPGPYWSSTWSYKTARYTDRQYTDIYITYR